MWVARDIVRPVATRKVDLARARTLFTDGYGRVREWLTGLPGAAWELPSVLPGWSVGDLAAHLALVADSVAALQPADPGTRPLSIARYVAEYAGAAAQVDELTRGMGGSDPAVVWDRMDQRFTAAQARLDELGTSDPVVAARRGPIRLGDFLATRVVEVVVHADDLARSLPERPAPDPGRQGERLAVRVLLDVLAERAPGRSVEVRVPPHAAVQCIPGPRHTRGTPPAVIELTPTTWLRLASGRTTWDDAVSGGHVQVSGQRADLAPYLSLL